MFFIIKEQKAKSLASASAISAYLGITEPAMFGINLKYRYPFYAAMIGSGVSSAFISFFKVKAIAMGAAGLPGVISIKQEDLWIYVLGMLIATLTTVSMTYVLSKRDWTKKIA